MPPFRPKLPKSTAQYALLFLLLILPLGSRYLLGWSDLRGYVSDLAIGSLLFLLLRQRSSWLAFPTLLIWALLSLGGAELVSAVGRMPDTSDLHYLTDAQFLSQSTEGAGISHPLLALSLLLGILLYLFSANRAKPVKNRATPYAYVLALFLLLGHSTAAYFQPSEADEWRQFNLPHKLLSTAVNSAQLHVENWLDGGLVDTPVDIAGLSQQDLSGTRLTTGAGKARNVLIVTVEGIPGAYIAASRNAIHSSYQQDLMPKLSHWAERAMTTPDYVLHSHQTIRGLYAMLCGDYSKLDSGTPKGVELLNANNQRNEQCLPTQLNNQGFTTHFLQGAGLQFMAKDKIMPRMGFSQTHGREWFRKKPHLEFAWGMDDKSYFEGVLTYVQQLRKHKQPWMLTLMTVGTHQPYAATDDYLARFESPKQAAVGYLDDALDSFLSGLEKQGVLKDTLVIITSDESHGLDGVRLASAWGFNLVFAPEQASLPALKQGVYGHVDLTASILDYFALPVPSNISGRSLFRNYSNGREMMSYTNGMLRQHDGKGQFVECNFQHVCRRYASEGFITDSARYLGRFTGKPANIVAQRATMLDQSLLSGQLGQQYQFANRDKVQLKEDMLDDWTANLVGAQYLELPQGSQTTVHLKIRALNMQQKELQLLLKTKEFDRDVTLDIPEMPLLSRGKPIDLSFSFDNLQARKAFSFHLLGQGRGQIEITDFTVISQPLQPTADLVTNQPTEDLAL
ncbi:MAG: phosphoglycerol transferase MdoB-like AlkP superfamily enzyme [Pseudomonas sp.]